LKDVAHYVAGVNESIDERICPIIASIIPPGGVCYIREVCGCILSKDAVEAGYQPTDRCPRHLFCGGVPRTSSMGDDDEVSVISTTANRNTILEHGSFITIR
jgi:hypothetical protein